MAFLFIANPTALIENSCELWRIMIDFFFSFVRITTMIINILYIIFNLCKFLIKCSSSTLTKLELTKIEILRENWDTSNVMIRETNSFLFSSSLRKFSDCESTDYEIPENRLKRLRERSKWKKQVAIVFKRERMFSTAKKKEEVFLETRMKKRSDTPDRAQ